MALTLDSCQNERNRTRNTGFIGKEREQDFGILGIVLNARPLCVLSQRYRLQSSIQRLETQTLLINISLSTHTWKSKFSLQIALGISSRPVSKVTKSGQKHWIYWEGKGSGLSHFRDSFECKARVRTQSALQIAIVSPAVGNSNFTY